MKNYDMDLWKCEQMDSWNNNTREEENTDGSACQLTFEITLRSLVYSQGSHS